MLSTRIQSVNGKQNTAREENITLLTRILFTVSGLLLLGLAAFIYALGHIKIHFVI